MISFLKRLKTDRRGNALVIAAAALPLVVGSAGIASDTIQWTLWKRQLQRAADSAALAGVYAKAQNQSLTTTELNSVTTRDLSKNYQLKTALMTGYPQTTMPANTGTWTHLVKVNLAVQRRLSFSSLFIATPPIITTTATAAMIPDGKYCVVALKKTGTALEIGGSSNVSMGCGAISNSTHPTSSVNTNGGAHNFVADPVAAAGGTPTSINGVTDLQPYHTPLPDPFAGKYPTDIPDPSACTNSNHPTKQNADGSMKPGCYNSFNLGNGTTTLSPGVYYLNNTDLKLVGQTRLVGTGVTIILTGTDPGSVDMSGESSLALVAPTTGTYANMLMIQAANADPDNTNKINGDNNSSYDGAFYFPLGQVEFTGSSAGATKCAMVVSYTVKFSGNTNLQNDMDENDDGIDDCVADTTVTGKAIRLIA